MPNLYAITDPASQGAQLFEQVEAALSGGLYALQYRDKSSSGSERLHTSKILKNLCDRYQTALIINDDWALAKELGVGVHLGRGDGSISEARAHLGAQALIGATCHNQLEFAEEALAQGASYIAFGTFFNSQTKPLAQTADLEILQKAKKFSCPVVAIGGITLDNAPTLIHAGANVLAVVRDLWQAPDIRQRVYDYNALFSKDTL